MIKKTHPDFLIIEVLDKEDEKFIKVDTKPHEVIANIHKLGENINWCEEGNTIIVGSNTGDKFEHEDVEYKRIAPSDIYAII